MKSYQRWDFLAWKDDLAWREGAGPSIALVRGDWFVEAINCPRDGDMGEMDEDGVWSRHWYGDSVSSLSADVPRYATIYETRLWLKKCNINPKDYGPFKDFIIVVGEESYVLFEE